MTPIQRKAHGLIAEVESCGCLVRVYKDRIAIECPFADGASWEFLQRIKNEVLGKDIEAVEYYPAEDDVVNLRNVRHLWYGPVHGRNHPEFNKSLF